MANIRQYIGARYVFKIYENSQDSSSAEWEHGVTYEPLTIVTYLNSTYASKKDVPGSVGNPAANPNYWIVTGAYNGQIATLQNQINILNSALKTLTDNVESNTTKIENLENQISVSGSRKFICIGDSYMKATGLTESDSYIRKALTALGYTENTDFFVSAENGYGFARPTLQFITLLQNITISIPNDQITDIIVGGGANDSGNISDISSAIVNFVNYAKATYPNARIHLAFTDWGMASGAIYHQMIEQWKLGATTTKVNFIDKIWMAQHTYSLKLSDGHPNVAGHEALARCIVEYLLSGAISAISIYNDTSSLSADKDCTTNVNSTISSICDMMCALYFGYVTWTLNNPVTVYQIGATSVIELCTITGGSFAGCADALPRIETPCIITASDNTQYIGSAELNVYGGVLRAVILVPQAMTIKSFTTRPCAFVADCYHS